jgi:hypothetical protein
MKNTVIDTTAAAIVEFPPSLMKQGISLVKQDAKIQLKFALLWVDATLTGHDGKALIKACYVAAGFKEREARGTITNSSKFVAPALLFRKGEMTENEFFDLKLSECAPIFKANGGMDGDGLNPDAWLAMREEIKNQEPEKVGGEARLPSGEEKEKLSLSAFQILSAAISLRKSELTPEERVSLSNQLLA